MSIAGNLHNKHEQGMTFIEMVVAISIFTVLSLVIVESIVRLYEYNAYSLEQANEVESARRGMTQWNSDVKEMVTAEDGTYPLAVIEERKLGYYSDTDLDNSVEYVEYMLATTTLTKYTYNATGSPATYDLSNPDTEEILSVYVRNISQNIPMFTYYNAAGATMASTSPLIDVRYISAKIIVNIDPVRFPNEFMLSSSVAPRNLKDNL